MGFVAKLRLWAPVPPCSSDDSWLINLAASAPSGTGANTREDPGSQQELVGPHPLDAMRGALHNANLD